MHDADVVITCTGSQTALVRGQWLKLGAHVTAVGSDAPDKQELDPELPARADLLVVDSRTQCAADRRAAPRARRRTDRQDEGGRARRDLRETHPGRTSASQLTVCDLTGVGVQDVAAANVVMEHIGDRGEVIEL